MAILDDFQNEVVESASSETFSEYPRQVPPDSMPIDGDTLIEKYIEVRTGVEFKILIRILTTFNFYGADGIMISLHLDRDVISTGKVLNRQKVTQSQRRNEPIYFSTTIRQTGSQWSRISFLFSSLSLGKRNHDLASYKTDVRYR